MIDATDAEPVPLQGASWTGSGDASRPAGPWSPTHFGIGGLTAVAVWSELGDCRRFSRSMQVVRHTGLDVTVDSSDRHRAGGHLSRQGPETLRWALFEAGKASSRATSPDHAYYTAVKAAHDGKLAAIAMARKLARRCYHTLRSRRPRGGLRHALSISPPPAGIDGRDRPPQTSGSRGCQLLPCAVPASIRAGRPYNTEPTALPYTGVTQSRLLSPTTPRSSST